MNQPSERKLTKKTDWLIIGAVLLVLFAFLLFPQFGGESKGGKAVISLDGSVISEIELRTAENGTFTLKEIPDVVFSIQDEQIAVLDGHCPDKICERTGYIGGAGESIICLPNRVIVQIEGESELDAIVR